MVSRGLSSYVWKYARLLEGKPHHDIDGVLGNAKQHVAPFVRDDSAAQRSSRRYIYLKDRSSVVDQLEPYLLKDALQFRQERTRFLRSRVIRVIALSLSYNRHKSRMDKPTRGTVDR